MAHRLFLKFILLSSVLLAGGALSGIFGQTYALSGKENLDLFSLMFPLASEKYNERDSEFAIDVRVRPSFAAPYQISIIKSRNQPIQITRYEPVNREVPLSYHVSKFLDRGVRDLNVIATSYKIQRHEMKPSNKAVRTINEFFKPHRFPKDTRVSLDGVGYDIWYVDSASRISVSLVGSEKFESTEPSLITWARQLAKSLPN